MLADVIEYAYSVRQAHFKLYGRIHTEIPHCTCMKIFYNAPRRT